MLTQIKNTVIFSALISLLCSMPAEAGRFGGGFGGGHGPAGPNPGFNSINNGTHINVNNGVGHYNPGRGWNNNPTVIYGNPGVYVAPGGCEPEQTCDDYGNCITTQNCD